MIRKAILILVLSVAFSTTTHSFAVDSGDGRTDTRLSEMVLIPAGEFVMGSDEDDLKETAPKHKVFLDAFYMDRFEVSNARFVEFLNSTAPPEDARGRWIVLRSDIEVEAKKNWWPTEILRERGKYSPFQSFEKYPVLSVSWHAAQAYCKWAGKRLPTEAEWEKAARGGLKGKRFPWGDELPTGQWMIYGKRWTDNTIPAPTAPVDNYLPNGYGLYCMAGNVWEWCSDWYDEDYYRKSPEKNPKGPDDGEVKVLRGGSWYNSGLTMRVALRNFGNPEATQDAVGFRCAMDYEGVTR